MYFSTFAVVLIVGTLVNATSRQKRCIVVQKQSGTHGDSSEGEDSSSEARKPIPDRHQSRRPNNEDIEVLPPQPVKYARIRPMNSAIPRLWHKFNTMRNRY